MILEKYGNQLLVFIEIWISNLDYLLFDLKTQGIPTPGTHLKTATSSTWPPTCAPWLASSLTSGPSSVPGGRDSQGRVAYTHLTFRQLDIESDCLARGLDDMGVSRGVRTILMVKPSLDFFALVFALFKVGAVPVVVDPGMGVSRMLNCLKESQAQALIGIPPAHVLRTLAPGYFKSVETFITVGRRWFWGGLTLGQVRSRQWEPYNMADTRADEIAAILFTTGSTGPAKGVYYTHGVFDAQVRSIRAQFGITPDEIDLPTFPLFALFDPALGMTAIIPDMDPTKPAQVNPERIIEAIVNHGVTNMFASPALLDRVGRYGKEKRHQTAHLETGDFRRCTGHAGQYRTVFRHAHRGRSDPYRLWRHGSHAGQLLRQR